tara:strand:+ start:4405 stop:4701 length:297 start_codon:yes stop_codon:yes gene_type:complete
MINYKRFDIEHEGKKIVLTVELCIRMKGEKVKICTTDDVLKELKTRGVEVGKCVSKPDLVSDRKHNRISGRWVFDLPKQQKRVITEKQLRKPVKVTRK